jgi:[ribosomal protein S5]-alanine N-acetyltransferase
MDILETERLWLRTWESSDLELASSLWGDPAVMALLGGPLSSEKIHEKLNAEMSCQQQHGVQYWPLFLKETDEFAGCCGLRPWAYSPPAGHELGFHLLPARWGQRYALEAAQGVASHGFDKLGFPMLRAGHHPENANSKKILLNLGFQFVAEVFYKPTGLMHPTYQLAKIFRQA